MNRIILTGKNNELPRDAAQRTGLGAQRPKLLACGACGGTGVEYAYPADPSATYWLVPCRRCKGEGAL